MLKWFQNDSKVIPGCFLDYCRMIRHLLEIGGSWLPWRPRAVWRADAQVILLFLSSLLCAFTSSCSPLSALVFCFAFFFSPAQCGSGQMLLMRFSKRHLLIFLSSWLFCVPVSFCSPGFPLFPWLEVHLFWSDYFFFSFFFCNVWGVH